MLAERDPGVGRRADRTGPTLTRSIARKWLDEGLQDRGITRDLDWGVPVDPDEFPEVAGKVFYVWFDAPIGYIARHQGVVRRGDPASRDWQRWWRLDHGADDVRYTEFMGKDNVPFHTLMFPGDAARARASRGSWSTSSSRSTG